MNNHKPSIKEAIVVEGRYDKNTLSQVINALIVPVNGFNLYRNEETKRFLRELAEKRGVIVLTDSDAAGFMIRKEIRSFIPNELIKDAYIPDIFGKEKRKTVPGKEGKLGVEGMSREVLLHAIQESGATFSDSPPCELSLSASYSEAGRNNTAMISSADLYNAGLNGKTDSRIRRSVFLRKLGLPERLGTKDLLKYLNGVMPRSEFFAYMKSFDQEVSDDTAGIR